MADAKVDKLIITHRVGWRWKRTTPNNGLIAMSTYGYPTKDACLAEAQRVNAEPYVLEIRTRD